MPASNQADATPDAFVTLDLPAQFRYLAMVAASIRELLQAADGNLEAPAVPEETLYGLQLAVHEICNNIIEHAYGHAAGRISLTLRVNPAIRSFTADLYDSGQAFDSTAVVCPDLDQPQEAGYGLFLARQLMDEVIYERQSGKNHWRLAKRY